MTTLETRQQLNNRVHLTLLHDRLPLSLRCSNASSFETGRLSDEGILIDVDVALWNKMPLGECGLACLINEPGQRAKVVLTMMAVRTAGKPTLMTISCVGEVRGPS